MIIFPSPFNFSHLHSCDSACTCYNYNKVLYHGLDNAYIVEEYKCKVTYTATRYNLCFYFQSIFFIISNFSCFFAKIAIR